MGTFTIEQCIQAPVAEVWDNLANIEEMSLRKSSTSESFEVCSLTESNPRAVILATRIVSPVLLIGARFKRKKPKVNTRVKTVPKNPNPRKT